MMVKHSIRKIQKQELRNAQLLRRMKEHPEQKCTAYEVEIAGGGLVESGDEIQLLWMNEQHEAWIVDGPDADIKVCKGSESPQEAVATYLDVRDQPHPAAPHR